MSEMRLFKALGEVEDRFILEADEERRKGSASFRIASYGDISHLYAKGEPASFSARFCECYEDDTRHD